MSSIALFFAVTIQLAVCISAFLQICAAIFEFKLFSSAVTKHALVLERALEQALAIEPSAKPERTAVATQPLVQVVASAQVMAAICELKLFSLVVEIHPFVWLVVAYVLKAIINDRKNTLLILIPWL